MTQSPAPASSIDVLILVRIPHPKVIQWPLLISLMDKLALSYDGSKGNSYKYPRYQEQSAYFSLYYSVTNTVSQLSEPKISQG